MASRHPYYELAQIIEDKLKRQREHDRRNDGISLFSSEEDEIGQRQYAKELRRLARIDLDNGYPFD